MKMHFQEFEILYILFNSTNHLTNEYAIMYDIKFKFVRLSLSLTVYFGLFFNMPVCLSV